MANNLITVIESNLAKINNGTQLTESQKKTFRELDYQLMFKTLESIVEETMLEYQGTECVNFLRQKYIEKFRHLLELMTK
jgi:RNA binding exosome subunit